MSEKKVTPGPWWWDEKEGLVNADMIVFNGDEPFTYEDMNLVAAAPELLEACLRIQAQFRQAGIESKVGSLNPAEDSAAQIDAVILKALGQQPL